MRTGSRSVRHGRSSAVMPWISPPDAAAEEQHRAGVREMPVHPVVFWLGDRVGDFDLILHTAIGLPLNQQIAAELARDDDERATE